MLQIDCAFILIKISDKVSKLWASICDDLKTLIPGSLNSFLNLVSFGGNIDDPGPLS